jgi:hypothetical protein
MVVPSRGVQPSRAFALLVAVIALVFGASMSSSEPVRADPLTGQVLQGAQYIRTADATPGPGWQRQQARQGEQGRQSEQSRQGRQSEQGPQHEQGLQSRPGQQTGAGTARERGPGGTQPPAGTLVVLGLVFALLLIRRDVRRSASDLRSFAARGWTSRAPPRRSGGWSVLTG